VGEAGKLWWGEELVNLVGGRRWKLWWVREADNFGQWKELATLVGGKRWQLWWVDELATLVEELAT
jgi:hypothetical protein